MRRRSQAYRKNWVSFESRQRFAEAWSRLFCEERKRFERHEITAPALCAVVIDQCWRDLFPQSWANGKRDSLFASHFLTEDSNFRVFLHQRYRGLPEAVPQSLQAWSAGQYPLQLLFHELSVEEVIQLQSAGRRCVSLMLSEEEILHFEHEGRDFLSFLIHDLIHAQHLMKDPQEHRRQVAFSCWLESFRATLREEKHDLSAEAWGRLDYMAADMNSHLIHLLKTLKALIDEIDEERYSQILQKSLSRGNLEPAGEIWSLWSELNGRHENSDLHVKILSAWDQALVSFRPLSVIG